MLGFTLYFGLVFVYSTRHGLKFIFLHKAGLPTWLSGRENLSMQDTQETWIQSLGWEDSLE